jgi:hypothetical protein
MGKNPEQPTGKCGGRDRNTSTTSDRKVAALTLAAARTQGFHQNFSQSAPECLRFRNESSLGFNE